MLAKQILKYAALRKTAEPFTLGAIGLGKLIGIGAAKAGGGAAAKSALGKGLNTYYYANMGRSMLGGGNKAKGGMPPKPFSPALKKPPSLGNTGNFYR